MKSIKRLILISLLLCGYAYGMDPGQAVQATVKTYMLPEQQESANHEFFGLLDNAKHQVLIAMYWITDDFVVDKIIKAKKRGVNMQVIFDESTLQYSADLVRKFINNGITPIVFPSSAPAASESLMHNKFLVFDGKKVWIGSANFTKKAFDPASIRFNHENIVVIDSLIVASN